MSAGIDMVNISRREFLALTGTAAMALAVPATGASALQMPTRPIPSTGTRLGIIGYGNAPIFSSSTNLEVARETSRRLFQLLLNAGGNYADLYLDSARNLAAWLDPESLNRLKFGTGYAPRGLEFSDADIVGLAQRLKKPRLDFLQVRNVTSMEPTQQHWAAVRAAKDSGQASHIGITVASRNNHEAAMAFIQREKPDFLQLNYSLVEPDAEIRLLPMAADLGIGVIVNRPFVNGAFFPKVSGKTLPSWAADFDCRSWAQFALKFIVSHKAVTCVIPETNEVAHAEDNLAGGLGGMPDEATRQRMRQVFAAL